MNDYRIPVYLVYKPTGSLPLALGLIRAYANQYREGALNDVYNFRFILETIDPEEVVTYGRQHGKGIWLFSNYLWCVDYNLAVSRLVKEQNPQHITIHGGPCTPRYSVDCEAFLKKYPYVDLVCRGEGEIATAEMLDLISGNSHDDIRLNPSLKDIKGIAYFKMNEAGKSYVQTEDRPFTIGIDMFPSPYLTGVFDDHTDNIRILALETYRGCPNRCAYCDWGGGTGQKIRFFCLDRAKEEIEWMGKNRVPCIYIADSNFGDFERDLDIAETIVSIHRRYGFPKELIVVCGKIDTHRITNILALFCKEGITVEGSISLQTLDQRTLKIINRENTNLSYYDEMIEAFKRNHLPMRIDIMLGLPGATIETMKRDFQFCMDKDIRLFHTYSYLLTNSPMANPDYLLKYQIETDQSRYLISTFSYTRDDMKEMMLLRDLFDSAEQLGALRYIARFLQWEYGIPALEFFHALERMARNTGNEVLSILFNSSKMYQNARFSGWWDIFYREVSEMIYATYGDLDKSTLKTAIQVNKAVMPGPGRRFPEKISLRHDFVMYFQERMTHGTDSVRSLASYPKGELVISDPNGICDFLGDVQYWTSTFLQYYFFELSSSLERPRPHAIKPLPQTNSLTPSDVSLMLKIRLAAILPRPLFSMIMASRRSRMIRFIYNRAISHLMSFNKK
ncbi:MAG: radical SAM protein [Desulfamplus sp.]|nr:radical SAM protein [Desulfamplus sp.]